MTLPPVLDDRPIALVFRSPLFNRSETFIQRQAAGLRRYQPVVIGLEDKGGALPELRGRLMVASTVEGLALKLGNAGPLARRLAKLRPKLLHAHFGTDGLLALLLARALGVPLVTTLRGYDVHRSRAALLLSGRLSWMRYALGQRRLMEEGALFLAVSDALRSRAAALGFPEDRLVTHCNGVDLGVFHPAPTPPSERMVLHVGRLVEKKGTALLIDAFARLEAPGASLVIVGDGPLRGELERRAASLGERVRFLGHLAPDEIAALMRRAWLLAAPSLTARDGDAEGLPNVVVEAAASGLPVVASAHAGIPEAVEHEASGLVVPEGEVAPLAEALQALLASPDLQRAYALAARKLAEMRFDSRQQAERLEGLYDSVVAAA
jgi:glycosyltransferase involved in cell wall biosynthesis